MTVTEVLHAIKLPAYEYFADPVELTDAMVVQNRDRLIREITRFAGLHSIYLANYQIYPGITKLDLIYVLHDHHDVKVVESGLIAATRKLISDTPIFYFPRLYPERIFREIYQLSPPLSLQRVHGPEIRFNFLPEEERSFTWCSFLNDRLVISPLNFFIPALVDGKFAVADTLRQLETTRDLLLYFTRATRMNINRWQPFMFDLTKLLQNWFRLGLERYQLVKELVRTAVVILFELIETFCKYLLKEKLIFSQEKQKVVVPETASMQLTGQHADNAFRIQSTKPAFAASFFAENVKAIFLDQWQPGTAFQKMIATYQRNREFYVYLPKELAIQLEQYSHGTDYHTKQVQKVLLVKEWLGGLAFPNVIDARNRLLSKQQEFLAKFKSVPASSDLFQYPVEKTQRWNKFAPSFLGDKLAEKRELERKLWQEKRCTELVTAS
ncbi:MAG: hypothetical protein N3A72_04670 [bacterium]|nr:hypothetical protein [bacterium]